MKVTRKEAHPLKLDSYYFYRQMENIISRIFTSAVMRPNFVHFHPKIGFKGALESFTSLSGHLSGLKNKIMLISTQEKKENVSTVSKKFKNAILNSFANQTNSLCDANYCITLDQMFFFFKNGNI